MDLVYLILSVWLRVVPMVRLRSGLAVAVTGKTRGGLSQISLWLPLLGWVVVGVQRRWDSPWLPQRVVSIKSLDRIDGRVRHPRQQESLTSVDGQRLSHFGQRDGAAHCGAAPVQRRRYKI